MSVHRFERAGRVGRLAGALARRWPRHARRGSRTFDRKRDAQMFDDELRRRRRLGELGLVIGSQETLDEYVTRDVGARRTR